MIRTAPVGWLLHRTPLGWRQLRHNPTRLLVALIGVAFADVLMFVQLGVMSALFDSATSPIRVFKADILLLSPEARALGQMGSLPRRRLYQALGVDGVTAGAPIQIGTLDLRDPATDDHANVTLFGIDPDFDGIADPELSAQRSRLNVADTALIDRLIRNAFSAAIQALAHGRTVRAEVMGRTVTLQGLFSLGASFSSDGTLVVSDQTYLRLTPRSNAGAVSAILLQVAPGHTPEAVATALRARLPASDTRVMTQGGYISFIKTYMARNTPIAFVFIFGVAVGLFIGFVIVYQILSADVNDHLQEYATLKAMGFTRGYLLAIVLEEALILAGLGFIPGTVLSSALYSLLRAATDLAIDMPTARAMLVFVLTLAMCAASGTIATRRLAAADPADVF